MAEYLRLSVHTIYKMAQQDRIPAYKVGKQWRFKKAVIDAWVDRQKTKRT
ncbi:MAG: helix-turn-helix domain-containing protein [bacterium]